MLSVCQKRAHSLKIRLKSTEKDHLLLENFERISKSEILSSKVNELFTMRGHFTHVCMLLSSSAVRCCVLFCYKNAPNVYINCWLHFVQHLCADCRVVWLTITCASAKKKPKKKPFEKWLNSIVCAVHHIEEWNCDQSDKWQLHSIWVDWLIESAPLALQSDINFQYGSDALQIIAKRVQM